MAGRPLRGMDKPFGKRVASIQGNLSQLVGDRDDNNISGVYSGILGSPQRFQAGYAHLGALDQPRRGLAMSQSVETLPS